MKKIPKCQNTTSGKHHFVERYEATGRYGYWKIEVKPLLFGFLPNGMSRTWVPSSIKYKKTGEWYCKYCDMIKDE